MKKIKAIVVSVLLFCAAALAVPAWRGRINYTQPDGSVITIQKHGDEFFHWTTDLSGTIVKLDPDGFYRPESLFAHAARRNAAMAERAKRIAERTESARNSAPASGTAKRSAARTEGHIAKGQKHFLVILVEFSDVKFDSGTANDDFYQMLNQNGYNINGGTGSARDFYYDNSGGYFEPLFDVFGPITLTHPMAYYGGNDDDGYDKAPEDAVIDGCTGLDEQIDFSLYDNDGDGKVDLVFMYYAGYGEADSNVDDSIWPHQWELSSAGKKLILDGKRIDSYACSNELSGYGKYKDKMCGIGTVCHEFGHAMGLPDFYDTDYEDNGSAGGLYDYSLMCSGSYNNNGRTPPYFNIEERIILGWLDESALQELPVTGDYTLPELNNNVAWKTPTDMDGEYFVYECRVKSGWDKYIPDAGMIVYHVDKSSRQVKISDEGSVSASNLWQYWYMYNAINVNGSHPCFYIVPAGKQKDLDYTGVSFAFPGDANKYTSYTPVSWSGLESDYSFTGISFDGSKVTLRAKAPSDALDYNVIANPGNGSYKAGDTFTLSLVEAETHPVASVLWFFDDEPAAGDSVVLRAGKHTVEAVLTLADGGSETVSLEISVD